ncbi:hypothetical protein PICMEDRAFT_17708 [Pichia membranifaciens NRRL Y-2026]|uniref:Uncharacterized protein n=1 Tax=Pichia membranifaciens NRRL Y-2026 TaxID=763406 RepID=A0A1E3NI23_9ASCO|nr:hypothetical protein PICMEDRAFT_17708 [Pichia membranifaciens NRRL Y-2026]ODQ45218.1 hypothetical protein PICMEDRAFT_17708 [Pichia membranifaciens NRRL Y-2026]
MKGSLEPDRLVGVYSTRLDEKLEDMLDEFDNFDYTHKPLLTQAEFEEEFLVIIEKLFRRRNKYQMVSSIFEKIISKSLNDQHKFLCLIDFMVNISRYDPANFKNLPNDIVANVAHTPIFAKTQELIYNMGRMNYQFKKFSKQAAKESKSDAKDETIAVLPQQNTVPHALDTNDESGSDSADEPANRIMDVSLAELTKKIMSKTKTATKKMNEKKSGLAQKEELNGNEDDMLDASHLEASDSSDYTRPHSRENDLNQADDYSSDENDEPSSLHTIRERGNKFSSKSKLETLVESDSSDYYTGEESFDENEALVDDKNVDTMTVRRVRSHKLLVPKGKHVSAKGEETDNKRAAGSNEVEDEDFDVTMNNSTSIMEHLMDYKDSTNDAQRVRITKSRKGILVSRISKGNELMRPDKPKSRSAAVSFGLTKRQKLGEYGNQVHFQKKTLKNFKQISPVKRKAFMVLEKDLDFLYSGLERLKPSCSATLQKEAIKGFSYKPAQYSLFKDLREEVSGVDSEVAEFADSLLNAFVSQLAKRCGGNDIDESQFVHPFEYNYIMEKFEELKQKSVKLPPIIFHKRFDSLFDYEGNVNSDIKTLKIHNTKVKGLMRLTVFETEDQYYQVFKKIVPRDKIGSRIKFLNNLITDGKSLFCFDLVDTVQYMMNDPRYIVDSEEEEEKLIAQQKAAAEGAKKMRINFIKSSSKHIETDKESTETVIVENNDLNGDMSEVVPAKVRSPNANDQAYERATIDSGDHGAKCEIQDNMNDKLIERNIDQEQDSLNKDAPEIERKTGEHEGKSLPQSPLSKKKETQTEGFSGNFEKQEGFVEALEDKSEKLVQNSASGSSEKSEEAIEKKVAVEDEKSEKISQTAEELSKPTYGGLVEKTSNDSTNFAFGEPLTQLELEQKLREKRAQIHLSDKPTEESLNDDRSTAYSSSKGLSISTRAIKKVLSTKECFELLAVLLFPRLKIDPTYEGIPLSSLRAIGSAYDPFRPYLLSLFLSDVFEFLRLPRYFKVDAMMFELQLQDLLKSANPGSKMKAVAFHG